MARPRILIVGGSTRAAADSARRAGWNPVCADLFADFDLRKTAEVITVRDYPNSLLEDLQNVRADGWFYCGALENHPNLIERMVKARAHFGPLLGTSAHALKRVRDPVWLARILQTANVAVLEIRDRTSPPDADGFWLQKPTAGAGGRLIRVWDQTAACSPFQEPHYFQQRVAGIGLSCLFRIHNRQIEWLGACRELDSCSASRSPTQFAYCGSVGPLQASDSISNFPHDGSPDSLDQFDFQARSTKIASLLVENATGLQGLIGLDFRFDKGQLWLMEVNPRYTASVEVLELATNRSLLNTAANSQEARNPASDISGARLIAKQILYASESLRMPDLSSFWTGDDPWSVPFMADIPVPNSSVEAGWPICTVLAEGPTWISVESTLNERVAQVKRLLAQV